MVTGPRTLHGLWNACSDLRVYDCVGSEFSLCAILTWSNFISCMYVHYCIILVVQMAPCVTKKNLALTMKLFILDKTDDFMILSLY